MGTCKTCEALKDEVLHLRKMLDRMMGVSQDLQIAKSEAEGGFKNYDNPNYPQNTEPEKITEVFGD